MIEVQDIFREHGEEYLRRHPQSAVQMKAYYAILNCRTSVLGGHVDTCDQCGHQHISYNSCRNRHCPKCQTLAKEKWIENQERYLLDVGYFHIVFTVPRELHMVFRQNQETMYTLFFKAVSETLLELGRNKKYLGAKVGVTAILHTWGQNLLYHPHIHCVVPAGGLTEANQWKNSRKQFFIPVKVLSKKFRGKFLAFLRAARLRFGGSTDKLGRSEEYTAFLQHLYNKEWVTYCKPPFGNTSKVIQYLGRYTHRVAISNNRILALKNDQVTFLWRDYADRNKVKQTTLSAQEFIRRFMLHVLPKGFRKIRHYGILASGGKSKRIKLCQSLTNSPLRVLKKSRSLLEIIIDRFKDTFRKCPCCATGIMIRASPLIV
jgi:hypothetical protein